MIDAATRVLYFPGKSNDTNDYHVRSMKDILYVQYNVPPMDMGSTIGMQLIQPMQTESNVGLGYTNCIVGVHCVDNVDRVYR